MTTQTNKRRRVPQEILAVSLIAGLAIAAVVLLPGRPARSSATDAPRTDPSTMPAPMSPLVATQRFGSTPVVTQQQSAAPNTAPTRQPHATATVRPVQAATAQPTAPPDREAAPDFSVQTLDGVTFRLADQRGKPVVLFFMASWCGACMPETRSLAAVNQTYRDRDVQILVLDIDPLDDAESLRNFRAIAGVAGMHWALDERNTVALAYQVNALDTTIIIDSAGRIAYRDAEPTPPDVLITELKKLLP